MKEKTEKTAKSEKTERRKKYLLIAAACIFAVGAAFYTERNASVFQEDGSIARNPAGGFDREVSLVLNADGLPEDYDYSLQVRAAEVSEEEAAQYFAQTREEIEATFFARGEGADHVTQNVNPQDTYGKGLVEAEWFFSDYHYITAEGELKITAEDGTDLITGEGYLLEAQVNLTCGDYREAYSFPFQIFPSDRSRTEQLLIDISAAISHELDKQGQKSLTLPDEVDGVRLNWSDPKSYLTLKVLFWMAGILVLLRLAEAEEQQTKLKKRKEEISGAYPEIVSKLSILMGAGMSLKQAWAAIAGRYEHDRKENIYGEKAAYEEMVLTMREIRDGESERNAYQRFGERCGVNNFYRLSRILIRNMQKGSRDLCDMLQKEAEEAFEERKLTARKLGEEAGTRMLLPLMLMMVIVIAIVIVPAFLGVSF